MDDPLNGRDADDAPIAAFLVKARRNERRMRFTSLNKS